MLPWWIGLGCRDPHHGPPRPGDEGSASTDTASTDTAPTDTASTPSTALSARCHRTDNPLRFACTVTVDPPQSVQVAFTKADGTGPVRIHTSDTDQVPLYFLAADTAYTWSASTVARPDEILASGTFTTGSLPEDIQASLAIEGTSDTPLLGTNLPCGSGATAAVFDSATGELLWYQIADPEGHFGGYQMVTFTEDHTILGQSGSQVTEYALDGTELMRKVQGFDYTETLHHDLYRHDGLTWLLYHEGNPLLDGYVVWDSKGTEIRRWFSADHLAIPPTANGDWMHTNTVYERDGIVYLSSFEQSTVLAIDDDPASPTYGQAEWILAGAGPAGFGNDTTLDWSAVDGANGFHHQHDVHLDAEGRLLMLDNDHGRALRIDLDPTAHTGVVESAWPTSKPGCGPQGTAMETEAGDLLVDCSGLTLQEFEPTGADPVWRAQLQCASSAGLGKGGASRWYPLDGW